MVDRRNRTNTRTGEQGFTLIEITFAVLMLAGTLTVLISLQSSVVDRTLRDEFTLEAMLIARRIQAALETTPDPVEVGEYGPYDPAALLRQFATVDDGDPIESLDARYNARLVVEWWGLPDIDEKAMKRMNLTVSWGDTPLDTLNIVYFIANDEEQPPEE